MTAQKRATEIALKYCMAAPDMYGNRAKEIIEDMRAAMIAYAIELLVADREGRKGPEGA